MDVGVNGRINLAIDGVSGATEHLLLSSNTGPWLD